MEQSTGLGCPASWGWDPAQLQSTRRASGLPPRHTSPFLPHSVTARHLSGGSPASTHLNSAPGCPPTTQLKSQVAQPAPPPAPPGTNEFGFLGHLAPPLPQVATSPRFPLTLGVWGGLPSRGPVAAHFPQHCCAWNSGPAGTRTSAWVEESPGPQLSLLRNGNEGKASQGGRGTAWAGLCLLLALRLTLRGEGL